MSGKSKKKKTAKAGRVALWLGIVIALVALILVASLWIYLEKFGFPGAEETLPSDAQTEPSVQIDPSAQTAPSQPIVIDSVEAVSLALGNGLKIQDVGSYTGIYMEDGSDEPVTGVLMCLVTNDSEKDVQLLKFTLSNGSQTASFSLTNLPAGESVVVLESSRMEYAPGFTQAEVQNYAEFPAPMSLCADKIEISAFEQAMNITNISGEDISGDILIYYKNSAADVFYGGITYRVRIEGGLKANEIRQLMPSHFNAAGSTVVLVTCG